MGGATTAIGPSHVPSVGELPPPTRPPLQQQDAKAPITANPLLSERWWYEELRRANPRCQDRNLVANVLLMLWLSIFPLIAFISAEYPALSLLVVVALVLGSEGYVSTALSLKTWVESSSQAYLRLATEATWRAEAVIGASAQIDDAVWKIQTPDPCIERLNRFTPFWTRSFWTKDWKERDSAVRRFCNSLDVP